MLLTYMIITLDIREKYIARELIINLPPRESIISLLKTNHWQVGVTDPVCEVMSLDSVWAIDFFLSAEDTTI